MALTPQEREIFHRDRYRCRYCDRDLISRFEDYWAGELDHLIPQRAGGDGTKENLVVSCSTCNRLKEDWVPINWERMSFHERIEAARQEMRERREQHRETWNNMSDEEKAAARDRLRVHRDQLGGGREGKRDKPRGGRKN